MFFVFELGSTVLCSTKLVREVCCFTCFQVVSVTALVKNVPVPVPLLSLRLWLDFAAGVAAVAEAARIAATTRRAQPLAGKHTYRCTLCMHVPANVRRHTRCTNIIIAAMLNVNNDSLCRSVLSTYSAPRQTVIADTLVQSCP